MAKEFDDLTTWRESGIRAVVKDEIRKRLGFLPDDEHEVEEHFTSHMHRMISERLGVSPEHAEDYTSYMHRLITQRIDDMTEGYENPVHAEDDDDEYLALLFKRFPKSIIWMLSGLLIGIGTGSPFLVVGIFGAILAFGWLVRTDS